MDEPRGNQPESNSNEGNTDRRGHEVSRGSVYWERWL